MNSTIACIGTASVRGSEGLYAVAVDTEAGRLRRCSSAPSINSGYVVFSPDKQFVFATQESMTFSGLPCGGVAAYRLGEDGVLSLVNRVPAGGQLPCHISIRPDGGEVYVSSYLKGCVSIHRVLPNGAVAPCHKLIQLPESHGIEPSVHCAVVTPGGEYLCMLNVTAHDIVFIELSSGEYQEADRLELGPPYSRRPRQIVFSGSHAYLLTETGKEVVVFEFDASRRPFLRQRQVLKLYPGGDELPRSAAACIKLSPDGRTLACSVRAYNLITTFAVGEDGALSRPVFNPIRGQTPRDFNFTPDGGHILVGAQQSDTMELYRLEADGGLSPLETDFRLPSCFCVAF